MTDRQGKMQGVRSKRRRGGGGKGKTRVGEKKKHLDEIEEGKGRRDGRN